MSLALFLFVTRALASSMQDPIQGGDGAEFLRALTSDGVNAIAPNYLYTPQLITSGSIRLVNVVFGSIVFVTGLGHL